MINKSVFLVLRLACLSCAFILLSSCVSSGPATSYYSLFSSAGEKQAIVNDPDLSVGVGPITLPEYLENPAIVSLTDTQRVRVAGYHAWAGNFTDSVTRVLADDLSSALGLRRVWAFPWDSRIRPDMQVRVVFDEFAGIRGGEIRLSAKWTLLSANATKIELIEHVDLKETSNTESVDDYVATLNALLNRLSLSIARRIEAHFASL